ncbi:hypothetical protein BDN67DRAFT_1016699 [Paxillus ammoniavirescens]|nr:hypothetical protein BDN67DRAFT_1016699 [Paxillus ammoniavirescens]
MAGRKGSVPFSKMMKDLTEFVDLDAGYLPDRPSLKIKDPLHMSKDNVESILRHWKARQENQFLRPIITFKDTAKQSRKTTEHTLSNITQVMPCNVTPAIPPPNDSPKSAVALSQQSKVGEASPNAEPTANASTPIASSFSQMEHNHGLIDDSSSESSSDSDESENTVKLWQCPNQHGATIESQVEFLRLLGNRNEYLGLINVLHLTQVMPCNVTPAIPPPNDSPKSAVALSQQSKVGEASPNAEPTANASTPIASSFSQMEHNHGLIDDSSSESSSDSDESENTVKLWQCPNQHGATIESQVEFLRLLGNRNEYLGLINVLHLTQVRTGSVEDTLPGRLDWKYDNFHLLPEGHRWSPKHVPTDVKGKWHEARDFMLGLSSNKQYRQLIALAGSPLSDFSWDTNSHHAGDVPHKGWAMAFKAITSVTLHDSAGEMYGQWYIALHATFVGMILHDVAMSKSTLATCTYPSLPSIVASTCITNSCVADAIQWCKTLRRTIVKDSQHKPTAQKQPKPVADLPAAKKPRKDAAQEPVIATQPTRI